MTDVGYKDDDSTKMYRKRLRKQWAKAARSRADDTLDSADAAQVVASFCDGSFSVLVRAGSFGFGFHAACDSGDESEDESVDWLPWDFLDEMVKIRALVQSLRGRAEPQEPTE